MPFKFESLHPHFIHSMVQAMYREEASQVQNPDLLTEKEMFDLYWAYMGYPL